MSEKQTSALGVQIGGTHYKDCAIQPVQFIEANHLGFLEGCVIKRLCRHDKPTGKGRQDIEKALHELQLLLEHRYPVKDEAAQRIQAFVRDETAKSLKASEDLTRQLTGAGTQRHANDNAPQCCVGGTQDDFKCGGCSNKA